MVRSVVADNTHRCVSVTPKLLFWAEGEYTIVRGGLCVRRRAQSLTLRILDRFSRERGNGTSARILSVGAIRLSLRVIVTH